MDVHSVGVLGSSQSMNVYCMSEVKSGDEFVYVCVYMRGLFFQFFYSSIGILLGAKLPWKVYRNKKNC